MRKKVDSRIRTLVENCVKQRQRSMFVIVGDKGRDQVVNLHYMLSKTVVKARPSVLWCYKKDLYLSRRDSFVICFFYCRRGTPLAFH
jgi:N-acetyltransferase 10